MAPAFHFVGDFYMRGVDVEHCGMVKRMDNLFIDNGFKITKIDDHSVFDVLGVCNGLANDGYVQLITVAVDVFAQSVVAVECMSGFKFKLFGDTNFFIH